MASSTQAEMAASNFGDSAYQQGVRKISSTIIESSYIGEPPQQDQIRYVEVPVLEDHIEYRKVKEYRHIEKKVGKTYVDVVEKYVDKPRVVYVDIPRDVPQVHEIVKEIRVPRVEDRAVEIVRQKMIPRYRKVEQVREIPQIIEVPKPYEVYLDGPQRMVKRDVPVIVCQTIKPIITQSDKALIVDVMDCEPEVIPVDIHVAKPVQSALEAVGKVETRHRLVGISTAQYNSILRSLNAHLGVTMQDKLPYIQDGNTIPFLDDSAPPPYKIAPLDLEIEGLDTSAPSGQYFAMPLPTERMSIPEAASRGGTGGMGNDERMPSARLSQQHQGHGGSHPHHQDQHKEYHTVPRGVADDDQSQQQRSHPHQHQYHHGSRSRGSHNGSRALEHVHEHEQGHSRGHGGGSSYASQPHHHPEHTSRGESRVLPSHEPNSEKRHHLHRHPTSTNGRGCACC